jgi:predicted DNA-binding transcriptional regulator YafY
MALNKNALIRYKTIDKCLQNTYRLWTLEDLIEACSDALYEYENRDINISKRCIQLDLQLMRSDKLGYNAPIEVYDKKYYRYAEEDYTITNIPITEYDMNVLSETVEVLKQFQDFSLFSELGGIIQKLEDKVYTEKSKQSAVIHLDKNKNLKGLKHLDVLYQIIVKKMCAEINYQSFTANEPACFIFHPYILKEFNNRWFVIGRREKTENVLTLALDRIISVDFDSKTNYVNKNFDGDTYFENTIGVTVLNKTQLYTTKLKIDKANAPYVLTKPFHETQKTLSTDEDGSVTVQLLVHLNYEFERLILGFGKSITVLEPRILKKKIKKNLEEALSNYDTKEKPNLHNY